MNVILDKGAYLPERVHSTDAGYDLRSPIDITVPANGYAIIDTGVHIELPHGMVGMIKSKSGLNIKHNLTAEGVIDEGYTGSIVVKLYNHNKAWDGDYHILKGDKITQLVIVPYAAYELTIVDEFKASERGDNGFGSTGR